MNNLANWCGSKPCKNGAVCTNEDNGYICTCKTGYKGVDCQLGECNFYILFNF